ncbi:hypothetical protein BH11BAC5_BH11BAC5_55270 [soil metagenome]
MNLRTPGSLLLGFSFKIKWIMDNKLPHAGFRPFAFSIRPLAFSFPLLNDNFAKNSE